MRSVDSSVVDGVRSAAFDDRYGAYLRNTLLELCSINTVPGSDLADTARREGELFDWVEREVKTIFIVDTCTNCYPIPGQSHSESFGNG